MSKIKVKFKIDHPSGIEKGRVVPAKEIDALRWIGEGYAEAVGTYNDISTKEDPRKEEFVEGFKPDKRQTKAIALAKKNHTAYNQKLKKKIANLANGKRLEPVKPGEEEDED